MCSLRVAMGEEFLMAAADDPARMHRIGGTALGRVEHGYCRGECWAAELGWVATSSAPWSFLFALAELPGSMHTPKFACKTRASERGPSFHQTTRRLREALAAQVALESVPFPAGPRARELT